MAFVDQFAVNLRCATPQRGHKRCRVGGPQVVQTEPVQQEQRQNYPLRIVDNDCALSVFSVCEPGQVRVDLLAYTIENGARIGILYPEFHIPKPGLQFFDSDVESLRKPVVLPDGRISPFSQGGIEYRIAEQGR